MAKSKRPIGGRSAANGKRKVGARAPVRKSAPPRELARLRQQLAECSRELKEAREQQTATADILRVISSSPTDVKPVLDAVAACAARLCEATDVVIHRVDGEVTRLAVHVGSVQVDGNETRPLTAQSVVTRSIRERRTIHVHDVGDPRHLREYPDAENAMRGAYRTILVAPLLREGTAIGAIDRKSVV